MRDYLVSSIVGVGLTALVFLLILGVGWQAGREPAIPWVCDDTRFVDTVPVGRGVVGPAVSAPPGCGGQGS
jgi:hypothetical protein